MNEIEHQMEHSQVMVAIRIRPKNRREGRDALHQRGEAEVEMEGGDSKGQGAGGGRAHISNFDCVLGPATTQNQAYRFTAHRILSKFVAGYNGTVMAYVLAAAGGEPEGGRERGHNTERE
jgi:hypothetical protein